MTRYTDRDYLFTCQYKDTGNLNARIALHQRYSINKQPFKEWLLSLIHLPNRGIVLDIGCGPGTLWQAAGAYLPADCHVVLADYSRGMVAAAYTRSHEEERFSYCQAGAMQLPLSDACMDVVIANFMLYHVSAVDSALAEARRVLKPGGRFYAATNGHAHMHRVREIIGTLDPAADLSHAGKGFNLENGAARLCKHFKKVELHPREDALVVTDAAPLAAYILSTGRSTFLQENPAVLEDYLAAIIRSDGAVRIEKKAGLFSAWREEEDEHGIR